jgi:hypothetical protein
MTNVTVATSYPDLSDDPEIDHDATNARYQQTLYAALRDQFKRDDVILNCRHDAHDTTVTLDPEPSDYWDWIASARHIVGIHYEHAEDWVVLKS